MKIGTKVVIRKTNYKYDGATGIVVSSPRWTPDGVMYTFYLPKSEQTVDLYEVDVDVVVSWTIVSCIVGCIVAAICISMLAHSIGFSHGKVQQYQVSHARLDSIESCMRRQEQQYSSIANKYDSICTMRMQLNRLSEQSTSK